MNPFIRRMGIFNASLFARFARGKSGPMKIAIVGNGGLSPEDQAIISSADCVIRFNNYATREGIEYSADRFQCDILFTTGDLHSSGAEPSIVVIGIPYPFKCNEIPEKLNRWYPKANSFMVNPYLNLDMCRELEIPSEGHKHPIPSIGFTCIWHLHQLISHVKSWDVNVFIAGFNWYSSEGGLKIQGFDIASSKYPTHWNHNYPKEVKWIISKLMSHPRFSFSESCWSILAKAKSALHK